MPDKYTRIQARVVEGPIWPSQHFGKGRWIDYDAANFTHGEAARSIVGAFSASTYELGEKPFTVETRFMSEESEYGPIHTHTVQRTMEIHVKSHREDPAHDCSNTEEG